MEKEKRREETMEVKGRETVIQDRAMLDSFTRDISQIVMKRMGDPMFRCRVSYRIGNRRIRRKYQRYTVDNSSPEILHNHIDDMRRLFVDNAYERLLIMAGVESFDDGEGLREALGRYHDDILYAGYLSLSNRYLKEEQHGSDNAQ